jgi:hypothetical protein
MIEGTEFNEKLILYVIEQVLSLKRGENGKKGTDGVATR